MSNDSWKLESDLCRCCHSEGKFKNLSMPCKNSDFEEIYSDMLKNCFDISLEPIEGLLCTATYTICDGCICRLRDATDFRKQVLACEERFRDMYDRNVFKATEPVVVGVKDEPDTFTDADEEFKKESSQDDNDEFEDSLDMHYEDDHTQVVESTKKKKKSKKTDKKGCRAVGRPRKEKQDSLEDEQGKKKGRKVVPKFHLMDEDYTQQGDIYQCSRCDKKYDKYFSLRFHVKTKHYKIPRFSCPICLKEFMTPAPLTVHKLEIHNIDDRFKCKACKGIFNTKVQLRKHINNFHMLGEIYKCEFCEYESFSFEGMYKHKFKHKTVKDYHCRFCRKSFLRKTTLDLHERIHTGDRRKVCTVCGQAFVQKASLNYHMTKYHPEVNF
ncbi:zinc finger protein OZF-like isoform X2 [Trichoplusia ni]|uniref:Zinc finger protein OZF-like isoform X2 n=1 Tax=Trichoplusia ni TaxID=7111 RepID=A0A7E5WT40_TRINI|nr:zinc finger protein OZF-like isoform X2 [Trichoplusia ni]